MEVQQGVNEEVEAGITQLTGDVTATGPGVAVATLATVNSNVGSFTYSSITVNAKGLITAASSGSAPEVPLTFSTGLTRTVNTITANISTGIAGSQTIYGGTAANEDLTIEGTIHATKTSSYVILQPTGGNVGIRNIAPAYVLDVGAQIRVVGVAGLVGAIDATNYALSLQNNATSVWLEMLNSGGVSKGAFFGINSNNFELYNWQGGPIRFFTNAVASAGTERLRINETGEVGVNKNSTLSQFYVRPTVSSKMGFIIEGISGQSVDLQQWRNLTTVLSVVDASGKLGIGVASPTAILHLKASTATASTASLKIDAGTLLTVPESGVVEFDGKAWYMTT